MVATQGLQVAALAVPPRRDLQSLGALSVVDGLSLAGFGFSALLVMEAYKGLRRV